MDPCCLPSGEIIGNSPEVIDEWLPGQDLR